MTHGINAMANRKQRRAQAKPPNDLIPLSQPSRTPPAHKTLLDIANERSATLNGSAASKLPSITTTKINPDGTLEEEKSDEDLAISPWVDTLLYTISLTLLHFTLTVLVQNQYSPHPPPLLSLIYDSTLTSGAPLLIAILVHILHPRSSQWLLQGLFTVVSVAAGCWLVRASNEDAYLLVMKKAPSLGVVWVWAVVESRWEVALVGVGVVTGYAWWFGYGFT